MRDEQGRAEELAKWIATRFRLRHDAPLNELKDSLLQALRAERVTGVVEGLEIAADGFRDSRATVKDPSVAAAWAIIEGKLREHARAVENQALREQAKEST